jgi:hypothetical protein
MAKKKLQRRADGQPAAKKPGETKGEIIAVPFVREYPDGQVGILANNFAIQHDGPEFHLLFFQNHPPLIFGDTEEEIKKAAKEIKGVRSVCVAHLIVSAERLPLFIGAMQEHLEKYRRLQQGADTEATQTRKDAE